MDPVPATTWRTTPPTPPTDRSPRSIYVAFAALLLAGGALVAVSSWAHPRGKAAFVSFVAPAAGGPPGFAAADHAAVGRTLTGTTPEPVAGRASLEARLKTLPSSRPAFVYLTAAATCDGDGHVVVLPADVTPATPAAGIPLRQLLTALAESSGPKFLVLDLSWPADSIPAEVAAGAVPTAILDDLDAVPDDKRLTLTSCGPGQAARVADELGRTPFGYYLEVGLAGWAAPIGADAVTAYGLANFVRTRVQRWAEQTRAARQTPQLVGEAEDFPLVPLTGRPPAAPPELAPPADSADWLKPLWASRDRLRAAGADRLDPLAMRTLGADLLAAEVSARHGSATPAVRQAVADEAARVVARCERQLAAKPFTPPNLASVAPPADPALAAVVRAAVFPPSVAKPDDVKAAVAAADGKLATVPPLSAARLVFDTLADGRDLARDAVLRANDLVAALKPRPAAVELVLLGRLADIARSGETPWDGAVAAQGVAVCRAGERAAVPVAFAALQPRLETATRDRYRGEELLLASDYLPPTNAAGSLTAAEGQLAVIGRAQAAATTADAQVAQAFALLTPTAADADERWQAATAAASAVVTARGRLASASIDDLAGTADALEQANGRLKLRLAAFATPFQPDAVKQLVAAAKNPDARATVVRSLDSLLATDVLGADARGELIAVRLQLVARLTRGVFDADATDGQPAAVVRPANDQPDADERAEFVRRERAVAALSALAAVAGQPLPPMTDRLPPGRGRLARDLFAKAADEYADWPAERLDLWHRTAAGPVIARDDGPTPAERVEDRDELALRGWLASWYDHAAATGGPFFVGAAAATPARRGRNDARPRVTVTGGGDLSESTPAAVRVVRVDPPAPVTLLVAPNDWFSAEAAPAEPRGTPVQLKLKAGSTTTPPPAGFLIESASADRPTFARVPVPLDGVRGRLDLFFSTSPTGVVAPSPRPVVRPGGSKSTSYLWVRNPGDRPKTLVVEVAAGAILLKQSVTVPAGGTEAVRFPAPAVVPQPAGPPAAAPMVPPAEPPGLPELSAPLVVKVTEGGRETRHVIRPDVRNPAGYALLEAATLTPGGAATEGKCRLEFRLRGADGLNPPARVEMRLSDRTGPAPAGTLRGDLRGGDELRLFADFAPTPADGEFRAFLDVDGVPRVYAFRVPAAPPEGQPLTLRQLDAPALTLIPPTGPRTPRIPVTIAADNAPPDATLEVALGQLTAAGLEADTTLKYPSARRTRVGFVPTTDGGLQFDADVRDWVAEFEAGQVRGRRIVRVRLLVGREEVAPPAVLPLVIDDRPPQNVAFLNLPKKAQRGTPLVVKAGGSAEVAGIREVQFFLGKSLDGKPPAGATPVPATATNAEKTQWAAELPMPKDKTGPQDVSVRFVTGTGVDGFANGVTELVDYDPVKSEPGTISGVVVISETTQADVTVSLKDEKGGVVKQAKTTAAGAFKFEGVPPGTYTVEATRRVATRDKSGSEKAKLPPGGQVSVKVSLYFN